MNKSSGYDVISFDVKHCFGSLHKLLHHIFDLSIQKGVFPDQLKIVGVPQMYIYKNGKTDLGNYRAISVLPCFSKILERIVYNRLFEHINSNNILYKIKFSFQKENSLNTQYYN